MTCPYCKVEVVDNRCPECGIKVTKGEPSKYKGEVMIDYDELQSIQSELEKIEELAKENVNEKTEKDVIWSALNGCYIAKTHFEVRENGYWIHEGYGFVNDSEAEELMIAIAKEQGYDVVKREPEIAPCPFCGEDLEIGYSADEDWEYWWLLCKCGYCTPSYTDPDKVIRLHNGLERRE
jgi:uncharacterized protein (UPF0212 family)